jgi:hypothetical protein
MPSWIARACFAGALGIVLLLVADSVHGLSRPGAAGDQAAIEQARR